MNELVWGGGCTTEADSKGEASEVVSMETDLQRIRNKGKRNQQKCLQFCPFHLLFSLNLLPNVANQANHCLSNV